VFCVGVERVEVVHKRRGERLLYILYRLKDGTGGRVFGGGAGEETGWLEDNGRHEKFITWAIRLVELSRMSPRVFNYIVVWGWRRELK